MARSSLAARAPAQFPQILPAKAGAVRRPDPVDAVPHSVDPLAPARGVMVALGLGGAFWAGLAWLVFG